MKLAIPFQLFGMVPEIPDLSTGVVWCNPRGIYTFALQAGCSFRAKGQVSLAAFALLQCRQQEPLGCFCLQDLGLKCGI